jgi:hypothetical protein
MYRDTKSPWIKWDPSIFLANTRGMNFTEMGIYTFFDNHYFMKNCIPLTEEQMKYLMVSGNSNFARLERFREKFSIFFKEGCFSDPSMDDALAHAKKRKSDSDHANNTKSENEKAKKASVDVNNSDRPVTHKEKEKELDKDSELESDKELKLDKELESEIEKDSEVEKEPDSIERDKRMSNQYPHIFKNK